MKKLLSLTILIFIVSTTVKSQDITDALRYSLNQNIGNARYAGMGGAMNALGGNLSAMESNPAGGAVFLNSYANFSLALNNSKNTSHYNGTTSKNSFNNFEFNQAGGVFVLHNENSASLFKKLSIGALFSSTQDYDRETYVAGTGKNTIADYFLNHAQGMPLELLELQAGETINGLYRYLGENYGSGAQTAFLGYQAYLFDPADPNDLGNTLYLSNVSGNAFQHEYLHHTSGGQSKFTITLSAQLGTNYYVGMNVNTHTIDFRQRRMLLENNSHPNSFIRAIGYQDYLNVIGNGVSFQFGGIARYDNLRIAINYDTPVWYLISEETSQSLESIRIENDRQMTTVINPNVINVYEDYRLRTPGKVGVGLAYVFNQSGLISLDFSLRDYGNLKYSPTDNSYFKEVNNTINNSLTTSSTVKLGGEYRWNIMSFRGGLLFEGSPYKDKSIMDHRYGLSLGTGMSFSSFTMDFAYAYSQQENNFRLFPSGFSEPVNSTAVWNNFIVSIGFEF